MVADLSSPVSRRWRWSPTIWIRFEVNEVLELICLAAINAVPGAECAGITLADRHGKLETPAAAHPLVRKVDALQYEFKQGPCVDAVEGRWQPRSDDLRVDVRWPKYGRPVTADLGIVSQMGIELFDEPGLIAGLNLYASTVGAFDDDTVEAALLFAIQATHTLGRDDLKATHRRHDHLHHARPSDRCGHAAISADGVSSVRTPHPRVTDPRRTLEVLANQILDEATNPPKPSADDAPTESLSLVPEAD